jgi:hypothetical protein
VPLHIHEFTLDLTDKPLIQKDGSEVAMKNSLFKRDHSGKYFEYKYYMNLSQTDCRMSLEAFSANGMTRRMLLQYSVSAFEVESAELQDEHRFVEQLSRRVEAETSFGKYLEAGPDDIGTRSPRVGNAAHLPSPPIARSLRTYENDSRSINDFALGLVTEGNIYKQSRQNNFLTPALLNNARPFIEESDERPHERSLDATNGVLDSQPDLLNVTMATKAVRVAMAAKAGMQKDDEQRGKPSSEDLAAPTQKRARRVGSIYGDSGRSPLPPQTPRRRVPNVGSPTAESETSGCQVP